MGCKMKPSFSAAGEHGFSYLLLSDKSPQNRMAENNNDILFLMILWVKNLDGAQRRDCSVPCSLD